MPRSCCATAPSPGWTRTSWPRYWRRRWPGRWPSARRCAPSGWTSWRSSPRPCPSPTRPDRRTTPRRARSRTRTRWTCAAGTAPRCRWSTGATGAAWAWSPTSVTHNGSPGSAWVRSHRPRAWRRCTPCCTTMYPRRSWSRRTRTASPGWASSRPPNRCARRPDRRLPNRCARRPPPTTRSPAPGRRSPHSTRSPRSCSPGACGSRCRYRQPSPNSPRACAFDPSRNGCSLRYWSCWSAPARSAAPATGSNPAPPRRRSCPRRRPWASGTPTSPHTSSCCSAASMRCPTCSTAAAVRWAYCSRAARPT